MKKRNWSFNYAIVWLVALAAIAIVLACFEGHLLWKAQQMSLFLPTSLFFKEQMVVAGGWLTWMASFLTQFLYWKWVGLVLLCGCWWLMMWITKRAFRIPEQWAALLLIPVALLLLTIVDMGYWIYVLKLQGHFFVATLGTIAVAALLWAYRRIPAKWYLRTLFVGITCLAGYPLLGIYGLAAPLLMALWSWRLKEHALVDTLVAVVGVVAVPLVLYRYVYYQTNLANIYYVDLPLYYITEDCHTYYIPFYLLALFFVALIVVPWNSIKLPKRLKPVIVEAVVLLAVAAGVAHFWFKDENFHHELAMEHYIDQLDWEGVVQEAALQQDEPTRAIVMMRNLALSRLGRQGNEMFRFKNGSKDYDAPFGMRMMLAVGPLIYYHYGMLNYSMRLCTEMGVEFGWRNEHLKMLAKCAMLNGEQQHARKYLGLLRRTLCFSDWAEKASLMVGDSVALSNDAEMGFVRHMMHHDNSLSSDNGYVEKFLMNSLASSAYSGDPIFTEQTLVASLWTRNPRQFWYHFSDYINQHSDGQLPRHYQEAVYLFGSLEKRPNLDQMPFDNGVKETYNNFTRDASQFNDVDIDVARQGLYPIYGQTYYYEYYLMDNLPEY